MGTAPEQTFVVEGMTCAHCELTVREELEELAGVESVEVDRGSGHLIVRGEVSDQAVREAVRAAGYRVAA